MPVPFEIDRRAFIASLGGAAAVALMDHEARAEALEEHTENTLDALVAQNQGGAQTFPTVAEIEEQNLTRTTRRGVGNLFVAREQRDHPRGCEKMPEKPTLVDFFKLRFAPANHVLQSATRAMKTGMTEEVILACLLHDVVQALVKTDHGWWGAQLFEPYVPGEDDVRRSATIRRSGSTRTKPTATSTRISTSARSASTTCRRRTSRRRTRWCGTTSGTWSRGW